MGEVVEGGRSTLGLTSLVTVSQRPSRLSGVPAQPSAQTILYLARSPDISRVVGKQLTACASELELWCQKVDLGHVGEEVHNRGCSNVPAASRPAWRSRGRP